MTRPFEHRGKAAGASPGTVVYVGEDRSDAITITRTQYDGASLEERVLADLNELAPATDGTSGVIWYNVDGVHDAQLLEKMGDLFGLHSLVVEDIVNTAQRPKMEDFGNYIFLTLKMIVYDRGRREIDAEHVSLILGRGFVLTFLEDSGDVFEPVRVRMRSGRGRLRKEGADYLAYALVDAIVDHYFEVLEALGDDIEAVEEEVVEVPTQETLRTIHVLKRELIYLRRAVWPLREAVNSLLRDDSELVTDATRVFLRDLYDHAVHVLDSVETLRDIVSGMLDVYLSSASNRMNQVMKVLTVMSSIFIPLTFIVGVYGMNFEQMPELKTSWGYPAVLLLMVAIAGGQLLMFRRKGWI
jgi:magnesium transporter